MRPLWLTVAACVLGACAGAENTGRSERLVVGDTTIVRTLEGSLWGDSVSLAEELSIGTLNGPPEYEFGQVQNVAVDANGGMYVFDGQVPALRYFDAAGRHVRKLGGKGSGPGEYQDASLGMVIRHRDGRIVMRDPRNARLNLYEPDGSPLSPVLVTSGLFTQQATTLDTADHLYLRIMTGPPERNKPWPIALLHLDDQVASSTRLCHRSWPTSGSSRAARCSLASSTGRSAHSAASSSPSVTDIASSTSVPTAACFASSATSRRW